MLAKIRKFSDYEIAALTLSPVDHDIDKVQTIEIRKYKQTIREAALIHYNMDLAALQCFAGGRWTGEQRRTEQSLRLLSHILEEREFAQLCTGMIDGVPNCLMARIEKEELSTMSKLKNHPNVKLHLEVVKKQYGKKRRTICRSHSASIG